jgi:NAD(P)-dependent dehydrogenase (short-subunit alcohol dehydrogenase family)
MAVTRAFLPRVRNAQGRVVCIGSIGGRYAVPFLSSYSASKAGVAAFCDSLRLEVAPWGIRVVLIEPGAVATASADHAPSAQPVPGRHRRPPAGDPPPHARAGPRRGPDAGAGTAAEPHGCSHPCGHPVIVAVAAA